MYLLCLLWNRKQHPAFLIVLLRSLSVLLLILAMIHLLLCDEPSCPYCVWVRSRGPVLQQAVKTSPQYTAHRTPLSSPSASALWFMGPPHISFFISSVHLGPVLQVSSLSLVTPYWTCSSRPGGRTRRTNTWQALRTAAGTKSAPLHGVQWLLDPSIFAWALLQVKDNPHCL